MRQFLIDDLTREERDNIESYLKRSARPGPLAGMYWLPLPGELLGLAQQGHETCAPFHFGIEVGEDRVSFEFLLRSQTNLHCTCIGYATPAQQEFLLGYINHLLDTEIIRA